MDTGDGQADTGGLRRALRTRQIRMISVGGALGTALFLGSAQAISMAGPSVVVLFAVGAAFAAALAFALAEMVSVHPEAGGFGALADRYLGPLAGYVQRWAYWVSMVVVIGAEIVAAALYTQYWLPGLPAWIPVLVFAALVVGVNCASVGLFGEFEYWLAMVKVAAVVLFIVFGVVFVLVGLRGHGAVGFHNWTGHGGFVPNGPGPALMALAVVTLAYAGTETVAMTAAESTDPAREMPRAARGTVLRLLLFYVLAMAVVVSIVPWRQAGSAEHIWQSPFVRLFTQVGIPAAAGVMNAVILTAALSTANTNLYVATRMLHSLALDGYAPKRLRRLGRRRTPVAAVLASAIGLLAALVASVASPGLAFPMLLGAALFTGLVVWMIIFVTHLAFRRRRAADGAPPAPVRLPGGPVIPVVALAYAVFVVVLTAFVPGYSIAWQVGIPAMVLILASYLLVRRRRATRAAPVPDAEPAPVASDPA
ncbi:amino acid permease [Actinocatenispora rupis]|uniref:Amino acid permease n=1 Tax=Actinocatenispora rupis TaxID=519421 RepID=A0A8J3NEK1_9ACTN|nr:amino acid permease [Actinocatenispora rupis]GID12674.1 amino acid permease [Actinocatenispora rupis]